MPAPPPETMAVRPLREKSGSTRSELGTFISSFMSIKGIKALTVCPSAYLPKCLLASFVSKSRVHECI